MPDHELMEELEALTDHNGLTAIIETLADMCREKAEHIDTNWQDQRLASSWAFDARQLEQCAGKIGN